MPKTFDAAFIIKSLGLTPIIEDKAGVNIGAITDMDLNALGGFTIHVHGGRSYELDEAQTIKLEALLKDRIKQGKVDYAENAEFQMRTQHNVGQKIERELQVAAGVLADPGVRQPWRRR